MFLDRLTCTMCWPLTVSPQSYNFVSYRMSYCWTQWPKCFNAKVDVSHFLCCPKCGRRLCLQLQTFLWSPALAAASMYAVRKMLCFSWDPEEVLTLGRNSGCNGEQTQWPAAHRAGNRPGCSTEVPLKDPRILNWCSHLAGCLVEALIQTFWQVHMVWQSRFDASFTRCKNLIFYRSLNALSLFQKMCEKPDSGVRKFYLCPATFCQITWHFLEFWSYF